MTKRNINTRLPIFIYELRDPRDGRTYYVGKSNQPEIRLRQHLADAKSKPGTAKGQWLQSLQSEGKRPKMAIVKTVTARDWITAEAAAIRQHAENGSPLTNILMPSGSRRDSRYPKLDMRSQDFWDDLLPQFKHVSQRIWIIKTPEGLVPYFLWNYQDNGWRLWYVRYHPSSYKLIPDGTPDLEVGFNRHSDIARFYDWREEGVLGAVFAPKEYFYTAPLEVALSPLELGEDISSSRVW